MFAPIDWAVYAAWVGLMLGLVLATGGFLLAGRHAGVVFPAEAYLVPIGAAIFTVAIAIDTIGHRTVYKGRGPGSPHHHRRGRGQLRPAVRGVSAPRRFRGPGAGADRAVVRLQSGR